MELTDKQIQKIAVLDKEKAEMDFIFTQWNKDTERLEKQRVEIYELNDKLIISQNRETLMAEEIKELKSNLKEIMSDYYKRHISKIDESKRLERIKISDEWKADVIKTADEIKSIILNEKVLANENKRLEKDLNEMHCNLNEEIKKSDKLKAELDVLKKGTKR